LIHRLYILTFVYALTACTEKGTTINDKQADTASLKYLTDTLQETIIGQYSDGWPEGLPKDTLSEIPLKTYSSEIRVAIKESALKQINSKGMNIIILEVYRCRAWDGKKWFTAENNYSALVCDKNSTNNSQWIIPLEYKDGKYTTSEWVNKY
jgi:hypothetical protein